MKALLEIEGLTVRRGGTVVLRGLTWRVMPGEVWTILGPNGSGKTSLLSCLTGLLTPSGGVVRVLGETFGETDWIGLRRRIGMVSSSMDSSSITAPSTTYSSKMPETTKSGAKFMPTTISAS